MLTPEQTREKILEWLKGELDPKQVSFPQMNEDYVSFVVQTGREFIHGVLSWKIFKIESTPSPEEFDLFRQTIGQLEEVSYNLMKTHDDLDADCGAEVDHQKYLEICEDLHKVIDKIEDIFHEYPFPVEDVPL